MPSGRSHLSFWCSISGCICSSSGFSSVLVLCSTGGSAWQPWQGLGAMGVNFDDFGLGKAASSHWDHWAFGSGVATGEAWHSDHSSGWSWGRHGRRQSAPHSAAGRVGAISPATGARDRARQLRCGEPSARRRAKRRGREGRDQVLLLATNRLKLACRKLQQGPEGSSRLIKAVFLRLLVQRWAVATAISEHRQFIN